MMRYLLLLAFALLTLNACQTDPAERKNVQQQTLSESLPLSAVPEWAKSAIWYQIFPERFRNGDPANDPKPEDLSGSYPGFVPAGWAITPWGHDWYAPDPYFAELSGQKDLSGNQIEDFNQMVQLRRYGGDLQGVLDQLDYLTELGINAIYFNPLNDAPSLHKYDPRHWRHIDANFGPDPQGDRRIMASENPADPATWQMTAADQQFVELVSRCHQRGIRVIMDYSWNHTGQAFWVMEDIRQNGQASAFTDWYWIDAFDDPATAEDELDYQGWFGIKALPEIRETIRLTDHSRVKAYEGNLASQAAKAHIFAVTRRWLDPNGDGDPTDGVDGFRLDVAGELPLGFWREYRKQVRTINPQAYLVGEIWWEKWPNDLLNPAPFLQGDVFDAVMNYRWFRSVRHFFNAAPDPIAAQELVDSLLAYQQGIPKASQYAMMNVAASHDAPRLATSLLNQNAYKYYSSPTPDNDYLIHKPGAETRQTQKLLLAQQFTYVGAPHIWAGDEMGMWGADDPACRKPLIWPDLAFDPEITHPFDQERPTDTVAFDQALFAYYQQLIAMRKANPVLIHGDLQFLSSSSEQVLAYRRSDGEDEVIALFNVGAAPWSVPAQLLGQDGQFLELLSGQVINANNATIAGRGCLLLLRQ